MLDRMARALSATWPEEMTVVGIRRRGVPLAERLVDRLSRLGTGDVVLQELELKRYSDDLDLLHRHPELRTPDDALELEGRRVLLMDDVLFSGRTLDRALSYCVAAGAAEVRCAVVCSRDGRELPITADFVGMRCDVGVNGIVDVRVPPYEDELAIDISSRISPRDKGG